MNEHRNVDGVTESIIAAAYQVSNTLGCGFLEKVYENALSYELSERSINVQQQYAMDVHYDGRLVGHFVADLLVESCVIVELKALRMLSNIHTAQCLNYLKASKLHVALLLNFGRARVQVRRVVL